MMKSFRQFALVLRLQARQAWYHRSAVVAGIMSWGVRIVITAVLYRSLYRLMGRDSVNGVTLDVAVSSMLIYGIMSITGGRRVYDQINDDNRSGVIEIWLNKPISYIVLKWGEVAGRFTPMLAASVICAVVYWTVTGLPQDDSLLRLFCGVWLFVSGQIILYLLFTMVGLTAVWLTDAHFAFLITDKLLMIFGGIYIPIAFYPGWFRLFGESLPMGAAAAMTQIFYPDFFANLPRFVCLHLFWIVVLGFSLRAMLRALDRRLTVNGG